MLSSATLAIGTLKVWSLKRIEKEDLPGLKDLYRNNQWPVSIGAYSAIDHFIKRFDELPAWEEKVKFWSLNDDWKKTGTFAMVNDNDKHIMFNTLEPSPYLTLRRTLELLDYTEEKVFICFRDVFRPLVLEVMRVQNLEATFNNCARCIYFTRESLENADIKPPDGFHFGSIKSDHIPKINSVWSQKSSRSLEFLSTLITLNPSVGLFKSDNSELVSWCLMLENGALGNLQVDENYYRRGFGELTQLAQMLKMSKEWKRELHCYIVHQNTKSFHLSTKLGGEWIDNLSWIGIKQRPMPSLIPLWALLEEN